MKKYLKLLVGSSAIVTGSIFVLGAGGLLTPVLSPVGGATDFSTVSNYVNSVVNSQVDSNSIMFIDTGSSTRANVTNAVLFPFGIIGQRETLRMLPIFIGTAFGITNTTNPQTAIGTAGNYPMNCTTLSNAMDPSTNFIAYIANITPGTTTNDPKVRFTSWESFNQALSNVLFDIKYAYCSNNMRMDTLVYQNFGVVTNDHTSSGAGARHTVQEFTMTGSGGFLTNPLYTSIVIKIGRTNDLMTNTVAVGNDVDITFIR